MEFTSFAIGLLRPMVATECAPRRQRGGGRRGDEPGEGALPNPDVIEEVAAQLGLDTNVRGRIKELAYAANREAIELRPELQRGRLDLRHMLDDDRPDQGKVMKQIDVVSAAENKLHKNRVALLLAVRELLTVEQRAELRRLMAARMEERGPRGF